MSAANAGFKHAAAPDGDTAAVTEIVNASGLKVATNTAKFNVDDFARAESDGGFGVFVSVNALVEADGGLQIFLDFDVAEEVVPAKGLLDHHEIEAIELFEERPIVFAVGGVGIDHELDAGKILAETLGEREIFARLDFDFDALVAGGKFFLDRGDEFVERIFNANGDAAGDFGLLSAEEFPERKILEPGFGVPDGGFDSGFGHVVSADPIEKRPNGRGGGQFPALDHGPEVVLEDVPSGVGVFGTVKRIFTGSALSPAGNAVDVDFGEEDAAPGDAVHTGFEGCDKLEINFTKSEGVEAHEVGSYKLSVLGFK